MADVKVEGGLCITMEGETSLDLEIIQALGCRPWMPFDPSVDLNAAFAAAERLGLWNKYAFSCHNGNYEIFLDTDAHMDDDTLASADTPALAICAAILKLKEDRR